MCVILQNSGRRVLLFTSFMTVRFAALIALVSGGLFFTSTQAFGGQQDCVTPRDNLTITGDTTLCRGTYTIPDLGKDGVILIDADNVDLNCNFATLIGAGGGDAGLGIVVRGGESALENITIRFCTTKDYGNNMVVGDASHVIIENNTFEISGGGKGLQLGNMNRAIDDILVQANTFRGEGNGMSFGAGNPATNVRIFGNTFDVTIDAVVLSGGPARNAYHLGGNRFIRATGEIIGLHDSDNTVIEFEVMEETTASNFLIRNSHNATIRNNRLEAAGFQIEGSTSGTYNANVTGRNFNITSGSTNNSFTNNIVSTDENWAVKVSDSTGNAFLNNTFSGGDNGIVILEGTSPNNRFVNTIIESIGGAPLYSISSGSMNGFASDYNDVFGRDGFSAIWGATTLPSLADWRTLTARDTHSLSANPLFMDAARGDFHLRLTSPLKNMGDPDSVEPQTDFEDDERPQGSAFDIGADEIKGPSTIGVKITGQVLYSLNSDFTNRLVIEDTVNDTDARYAITNDDGKSWLQSNGTLAPTQYFDSKQEWLHVHVPANTLNAYRFAVASEGDTEVMDLSRCALLLRTPSVSNAPQTFVQRVADLFTQNSRSNSEASESTFENEYRCPRETFSIKNHDALVER